LTDITATGSQTLCDYVHIDTTQSRLLYNSGGFPTWSSGFMAQIQDGKLVYLAGRPYRLDFTQLRANMALILDSLLNYTGIYMGVDEVDAVAPTEYQLSQNYPNPFNPNTTIKFGLSHKADVKLEIFDVLGRKIRNLVNESMKVGYYTVDWDGKNNAGDRVASGIYFYKLQAGDFISIKKMTIIR
jgi:hypothetical protein